MKHEFTALPKPGFEIKDSGFKYVVVRAEPHINRDGQPSMVITWRCACAEDGQPFEATTGPRVWNLPRRCRDHNQGWARARPFNASAPAVGAARPAEPAGGPGFVIVEGVKYLTDFEAPPRLIAGLHAFTNYLMADLQAPGRTDMYDKFDKYLGAYVPGVEEKERGEDDIAADLLS